METGPQTETGGGEVPTSLEIGDVIQESFRVVGESFGTLTAIATLVIVPGALIGIAIEVVATDFIQQAVPGVAGASADELEQMLIGFAWLIPAYFAVVVVTMAMNAVGQAGVIYATIEHLVGRKASIGEALRVGISRVIPLFVTSMLVAIISFIGLCMVCVPGFVAMVWLCLALPACAVERLGPIASIERSIELTEGHRLQIFLIGLVLSLAFVGLSVCVIGPASVIAQAGVAEGELPDPLSPGQLVFQAISVIVQIGWFTVASAAVAVIYARLRGLREGVDAKALASVFS